MRSLSFQIGPGYVELFLECPLGPIVMLQSVTPVEPLLQKVVHRMYCPPLLVMYARIILFGESVMVSFGLNHSCLES